MIEEIHRSTQQQQANLEMANLNPLLLAPKELTRMKQAYTYRRQLDSLSLFQQHCERRLTEESIRTQKACYLKLRQSCLS